MIVKTLAALLLLSQTTACVMVPEIKFAESYDFDFAAPSQRPIGYADLLCCFDCTV